MSRTIRSTTPTSRAQIPKGQYGGGEVIVWDRGRWEPEGDPVRGLKKGRLDFTLEGAKLKGRWHLVRMGAQARREAGELAADQGQRRRPPAARPIPTSSRKRPSSVISGRTVEDIAAGKPAKKPATKRKDARPARPATRFPASSRRRSPRSSRRPPQRRRLGARDQVRRLPAAGADPRRQGEAADPQRPGLDRPLRRGAQPALSRRCRPGPRSSTASSWSRAPAAPRTSRRCRPTCRPSRTDRFRYYLFDLLYLDGEDLRRRAARRPQGPAGGAAATARPSRFASASISTRTARSCCGTPAGSASRGWSRSSATPPIRPAATRSWIKSKCSDRQEFVIAGYVPSSVSKDLVGSLVLGYHKDGKLVHAGRVGTGFSREVARDLAARLEPLRAQVLALRREADRRRGARRRLGQAASWSPRSSSAPGPPTASCATPPSAACARTSRRARSPAKRRPRPPSRHRGRRSA